MSACANLSGGIRQVEPRYVRLRSSGRSVLFDGGFERPEKHPGGARLGEETKDVSHIDRRGCCLQVRLTRQQDTHRIWRGLPN